MKLKLPVSNVFLWFYTAVGLWMKFQYVTINLIHNFMGIGGTVHYAIQRYYNFCACGQVV